MTFFLEPEDDFNAFDATADFTALADFNDFGTLRFFFFFVTFSIMSSIMDPGFWVWLRIITSTAATIYQFLPNTCFGQHYRRRRIKIAVKSRERPVCKRRWSILDFEDCGEHQKETGKIDEAEPNDGRRGW